MHVQKPTHHINIMPTTIPATRSLVRALNAAAPPTKVSDGSVTLLKVPTVGVSMGVASAVSGGRGIGYGGVWVLEPAMSGSAGGTIAEVVEVEVVLSERDIVAKDGITLSSDVGE